jgi:hypothetical protein
VACGLQSISGLEGTACIICVCLKIRAVTSRRFGDVALAAKLKMWLAERGICH